MLWQLAVVSLRGPLPVVLKVNGCVAVTVVFTALKLSSDVRSCSVLRPRSLRRNPGPV